MEHKDQSEYLEKDEFTVFMQSKNLEESFI
jgi:hypothetical protein